MPAKIEELRLKTGKELIDYLVDQYNRPPTPIYRGESDVTWTLKPSVWRTGKLDKLRRAMSAAKTYGGNWHERLQGASDKSPEEIAPNYFGEANKDQIERLRDLVLWLEAERLLVNDFCISCDRSALAVPGMVTAQLDDAIVDERIVVPALMAKGKSVWPTPIYPLSESYAFAQHMGIPTRLLDFSDSGLKALYFAASGIQPRGLLDPRESAFAVWIARDPHRRGDKTSVLSTVMQGGDAKQFRVLRSRNAHLHAQDGLFLSCNVSSNRYFLENGEWPAFDQVMHDWELTKLIGPIDAAADVLDRLRGFGIEESTMKPSYTRIADAIVKAWCPK